LLRLRLLLLEVLLGVRLLLDEELRLRLRLLEEEGLLLRLLDEELLDELRLLLPRPRLRLRLELYGDEGESTMVNTRCDGDVWVARLEYLLLLLLLLLFSRSSRSF
jgi:hypothetical protein